VFEINAAVAAIFDFRWWVCLWG